MLIISEDVTHCRLNVCPDTGKSGNYLDSDLQNGPRDSTESSDVLFASIPNQLASIVSVEILLMFLVVIFSKHSKSVLSQYVTIGGTIENTNAMMPEQKIF